MVDNNKEYKEGRQQIFMGWNGDGEYIDYTLLKKKGILKIKEEQLQKRVAADGGFVDFTKFNSDAPAEPKADSPAPNFDFLSTPAGTTNNPDSPPVNPLANFDVFTPSTSTSELSGTADAKEMNALKIKIDDLDYKINNFIDKIDKIEEKLSKLNFA